MAGTVVTDSVFSRSTQGQQDVAVTFGQVFKDGDVPRGATLAATLNGQPVTLQVNPKATNPDGSLRHAVLTAMVPSLPAGAKLPLTLYTGAALTGPTIGLSQLLATGYDAKISLNIGGTLYTASARSLLQAANLAGACAAWDPQCNVWLSGPLASEWVVNGLITASNGTSPNLRVYFAVRAYSNGTPGTVGRVRTDIIVENSDAFAPQTQPQYTATLTSGSASYTSPALTQYTATRWHKVLWWNNDEPQVYLQQDTQYIQDSKAVSRYMPLTPDESFLAGLRQSCAPLDNCDQTKAMGQTGAQESIGPLPRWASVYILDPDVRAYNWMLANTDALGAYGIHYRDAATGWPVSIQKHPYVSIVNWVYANTVAQQNTAKGANYRADLLPNCVNNSILTNCSTSWYGTGNPNVWDNAHQPAESYVPYMVTGDYYYMSELAFGASNNNMWPNEAYRGYSQGLIDGSHGQVRGKAWVLREMANAAWLLPDSYPLKAEFKADVENSLADWNAKYTNNPDANPLHLMTGGAVYSMNGGTRNGMAPWQHNFLTWSAGHAAELGFAGAIDFRNWLAKFEIGLMTDWQSDPTHGFCWVQAAAYNVQVKDSAGNWLPSYTAVYAATFPTLVGLACNSPAMSAITGRQEGEMTGYPYSSTGYPANFQIGLASAADSGLPSALTAWAIFDSRSVKPSGSTSYNNYPNFAVIPRSSLAGVQPPPTMPPTLNPPPTTSNPPLVTTTPPPVPKELPARKCADAACAGTTQPSVSKAEPVRSTASTPASQPTANSPVSGTAHTSVTQMSTGPARMLVRVICARFDTWCSRYLPQRLYVPAPGSTRPQAAAGAPARTQYPAAASPVAPRLTPTVSAVTHAPAQDASGRTLRR
ncbi:MAG TPA: hypothetical protein VJL61_08765 [Rhodanobacteraceae bacterium]|nr:hypothetical protein [Rhodanobacteraceae bacterium]